MSILIPAYDYSRWPNDAAAKPISSTINIDICAVLFRVTDASKGSDLLTIGLITTFPFDLVETSTSKHFQYLIHDSVQRLIIVRIAF